MKSLSVKLGVIFFAISLFVLGCKSAPKAIPVSGQNGGKLVVDENNLHSLAETWGEDWVYFGEWWYCKEYYNTKRINFPSEDIVRVWVRCGLKQKLVANRDYLQNLYEIDCRNQRYKNLFEEGYSKEGFLITRNPIQSPAWFYIRPNDHMESLLAILCKRPTKD